MQNRLQITWKHLSAIAAVGLLTAAIFSLVMGNAGAQGVDSSVVPSINVSGTGESFGAPDIAYVYLGVNTANANVTTAINQANEALAAIVAAMSDQGIAPEDIQTASYSVYPEDRYDPQTGQPTGERIYRVQQTVTVTVRDISKTGAVIDAGVAAGANVVNGVSFGIADTSALEAEARTKAVADARARAEQLAAAFGVTLGEPIVISEGYVNPPIAMGGDARVEMFAASVTGSQVNPGQMSVSVQVNVSFAIGQ